MRERVMTISVQSRLKKKLCIVSGVESDNPSDRSDGKQERKVPDGETKKN